ncbi:lipoate--protein ligase family protein [Thermodesulfovibrio hydrogeniphilus]
MQIRFIEYQSYSPPLNMAIDEAISIFVRDNKILPTFRLYGWNETAITIGEFQKIEGINYSLCCTKNIPIIRRPTGGKGILHYDDLTYSFSAKKEGRFRGNLFQNYETLSKIFEKAFKLTGIDVEIKREKRVSNKSALCFALSSFGEICFNDIKIIGSAQKRWKDGFLQQGTIPIKVDRELLKSLFICKPEEADKIYGIKELFPDFSIERFQENIKQALRAEGFVPVVEPLSAEEFALAQELVERKNTAPHKNWTRLMFLHEQT